MIFLGEGLAIYAEMISAKTILAHQNLFLQTFIKMFFVISLGGALLVAGYMLSVATFKNIWIVAVISITSILIIEPVLVYTLFHQLPTTGAFIGFILGVLGLLISLFF